MADVPIPEKVALSFAELKVAAAQLNTVSDQLGQPIAALESALKRLNLGVPAWVKVQGGNSDDGDSYWLLELGYDRIASTWGIAIRERSGSEYAPEDERLERWLFANAPRRYRADAIDHLPELLEALTVAATSTTEQLRERISKAQEVATAFRDQRPITAALDQARALHGSNLGDLLRHKPERK